MHRQQTVDRFRRARSHPRRTVLEGFHPLKHALRFGATVLEALSPDPGSVLELARELAPDLRDRLEREVAAVPRDLYDDLVPRPPDSGVVARARRPSIAAREVLEDPSVAPVVALEAPSHLGNLGAAVRVAAAAGAAGVVATGDHDPWHATALRGSAGLHYALPVAGAPASPDGEEGEEGGAGRPTAAGALPDGGRTLVAVDPGGTVPEPGELPRRSLLAFGTERRGLRAETLRRADRRIRIPMRTGVSSLNLATAVAAVLYGRGLDRGPPDDG